VLRRRGGYSRSIGAWERRAGYSRRLEHGRRGIVIIIIIKVQIINPLNERYYYYY